MARVIDDGEVIATIADGTRLDAALAMLRGLRDGYPGEALYIKSTSRGCAIVQAARSTEGEQE